MRIVERAKAGTASLRERSAYLDHAVRTQEHYTTVQGNQQAGGVTYFGFLSIFPLIALAFFAVGWVSRFVPETQDALLAAIDEVLPGLVGDDEGEVSLEDIEEVAGRVGLIGLVGVLYTGLGWVSSLRQALVTLFAVPYDDRLGFVPGKVRDLGTLALLGTALLVSVGVSGVVTRFSGELVEALGLAAVLGWALAALSLALGVGAGTLLFFLMFRTLVEPQVGSRSLWAGALVGAVAFEVLKQLSGLLLAGSRGQPAFQAFGIALILLVWINYSSRVILYGAAWAQTDQPAADPQPPHDQHTPEGTR